MSDVIIPDVLASDVPETVETVEIEEVESTVNWSEKNLAELVKAFEELVQDEDRMKKSKEAEAIKAAFYKRLQKEKADAGYVVAEVEEGAEDEAAVEETAENPFAEVEKGFKGLYNTYKRERAEYNRQLDKEREHNQTLKEAVIADLKALLEKQEDVNATFPEFREIQNRWRAIGPVPAQSYRNLNETYQLYVEQFYDMVKINRELRDLDFKKNLEAKEQFCQMAEALAENPNVIEAFKELQKLHEQWKEFGPVAKEYRDSIWERFKVATSVVNKKYQAFFEGMKEQQAENLQKKTVLCEKVEEIAEREVASSNEWNAFSKEIEDIQKEWKTIGFASRKDNQKIYDRFRAACDKFYGRKREFYNEYKGSINANLEKKVALCEAAEALKSSTEWKKATDQFINLQKQWKEIGAVPRKKSEQLWKRFRAACDEFFAERDKNAKPENDYYGNLKAKQRLVEEIKAYVSAGDEAAEELKTSTDWKKTTDQLIALQKQWKEIGAVPRKKSEQLWKRFRAACDEFFAERDKQARPENDFYGNLKAKQRLIEEIKAYELVGNASDNEAMQAFQKRWQEIGFVPFKEKDNIAQAYKAALQEKFPSGGRGQRKGRGGRPQLSEKDRLIQKYNQLEQDVVTYENNIGFFSMSKNAEPLIKQMQERIVAAKAELKSLADQIRVLTETEE